MKKSDKENKLIEVWKIKFRDGKHRKSIKCWYCGFHSNYLDGFGCCVGCGTNLKKFPKRNLFKPFNETRQSLESDVLGDRTPCDLYYDDQDNW